MHDRSQWTRMWALKPYEWSHVHWDWLPSAMVISNLRACGRFGHSIDESICNEGGFFFLVDNYRCPSLKIDGQPLCLHFLVKWALIWSLLNSPVAHATFLSVKKTKSVHYQEIWCASITDCNWPSHWLCLMNSFWPWAECVTWHLPSKGKLISSPLESEWQAARRESDSKIL